MAVMGVAMLITGFVSSRIGAKRTLLVRAGADHRLLRAGRVVATRIGAIVGFRAGWGLGNALFIATALATIVSAASGSVAQAIILFEAALGLGIAAGPIVGGQLGSISWRGPFFGVAVLMVDRAGRHRVLPAEDAARRRAVPRSPTRSRRCATPAC